MQPFSALSSIFSAGTDNILKHWAALMKLLLKVPHPTCLVLLPLLPPPLQSGHFCFPPRTAPRSGTNCHCATNSTVGDVDPCVTPARACSKPGSVMGGSETGTSPGHYQGVPEFPPTQTLCHGRGTPVLPSHRSSASAALHPAGYLGVRR